MLKIQAKRNGDRPFFTDFEGPHGAKNTLTYNQVLNNGIKLAKWMKSQGVQKGDRIVVSGKNSPEWGTVFHAILYASGIVIPIDNGLHEPEVVNIV